MNKIKALTIFIVISILITGCSGNKASNTKNTNTVSNKNNNTVSENSNSSAAESQTVVQPSSSVNLYESYNGIWVTESELKTDSPFGISANITVDKDDNLKGEIGNSSFGFGHVANVNIEGKIKNNKFVSSFDNDGWDNSGRVQLDFRQNIITLTIDANKKDENKAWGWGIFQGTINLYNINSSVHRTITDLKNGGWKDVTNQCFNIKLNSFGNVKFITETILNAGYNFYLEDNMGNIVYKFSEIYENKNQVSNFYLDDISAVSFTDVNNDGLKDVIVIEKGKDTGNKSDLTSLCNVFIQKNNKSFINDKSLDDKINNSGNNTDIKTVIKYVKENIFK